MLTTPNNPTGKPIDDMTLQKIIRSVRGEAVILIDRACINTLPEISTKDILAKYKNKKIIVLHSFSKSHSLSDSRVGYFATNRASIAELLFKKPDINHNLNALQKLKSIIDNKKHVAHKKKIIRDCNKLLKARFSKIEDSTYYESYSNFAVIKLPSNVDSIRAEQFFAKHNILVMGGHRIGLGNEYIRIHMSGMEWVLRFMGKIQTITK